MPPGGAPNAEQVFPITENHQARIGHYVERKMRGFAFPSDPGIAT